MALRNQLKREVSGNEVAAGGVVRPLKKESTSKKETVKAEKKRVVKKEKVNRLEQIKKYFRGVYQELKKVHWPTRREVVTYTAVVFVAVTVVGILIWTFDSLLSWVLQLLIK